MAWRYHIRKQIMRIEGHRGRLTAEHFMLMRMPRRFWEASFDRIDPGVQPVVRNYLKDLDTMLDNGDGLLLWGENGRGKTSIAAFVAKEVRRTGASVLMSTAASLLDSRLQKTEVDDGLLVDRARSVDFLLIDDMGREPARKSGFSDRFFENLLRERGANRLTTWITTNMGRDGLAERYKHSMMEVLKELVVPVKVEGDNHRNETEKKLRSTIAVGQN
jgi:DNA replication protein DnaC